MEHMQHRHVGEDALKKQATSYDEQSVSTG